MNYIEIELDEWQSKRPSLLEKVVRKLLPSASPDLEMLYRKTKYWWLEYDDSGVPQREIGFDENRMPLVIGPIGKNMGFIVDSANNWLDYKEESTEAAE